MDRRGLGVLTTAHVFTDLNQSALPAVLPFLVTANHLSLATAASLILAMNLTSSVVQPLFGAISDRRSLVWTLPASVFIAAAGTAAVGIVPGFWWKFACAMCAGIGVAAFHPEGSRFANYCSGDHRATGMSWFTVGGYVGFALGPLLITPMLLLFGMRGTLIVLLPGTIATLILLFTQRHFASIRARAHAHPTHKQNAGDDDWRAFGWLCAVVGLRATAFFGTVTFLPLLFINVLHVSKAQANTALSVLLITGAVGTLIGGRLGDRFARAVIVRLSIALIAALAAVVAFAAYAHAPQSLALVAVAVLGFAMSLSASVLVVLGQEYLPKRIGTASGVTLGLGVSLGGAAAPIFGAVGDRYGVAAVFVTIAFIAAVSFLCAFMLPDRALPPEIIPEPTV